MTDLRSRVHLFDEKLTLSPEFMASFYGWTVMRPNGQTAPSNLAQLGIDSWMKPACATFSQMIGPEPAAASPAQITAAVQTSFAGIDSDTWDSLRDKVESAGKSTWLKLTMPAIGGKPVEIGSLRPDGTPEYKATNDLVDGTAINLGELPFGLPSLHYTTYKFSRTVDVSPIIIANPGGSLVNGAGVKVKFGEAVEIEANGGAGFGGGPAGGFLITITPGKKPKKKK